MRRLSPIWIALAAAVVIAVGAIAFGLRGAGGKAPVKEPRYGVPLPLAERARAGELPRGLTLKGATASQSDAQGNPIWSARSQAEFRSDGKTRTIVGRDIHWELTRGRDTVSLTAKSMQLGWETGAVEFAGGIDLIAGRGRRFTMGRARFEPGTRKIVGEEGVRSAWGRFSLSADTLVVDTQNRKVRLRGGVRLAQQ